MERSYRRGSAIAFLNWARQGHPHQNHLSQDRQGNPTQAIRPLIGVARIVRKGVLHLGTRHPRREEAESEVG